MTTGASRRFTPATPADPDPYSRAEMDEKLNDINTIQYDSINDFKCKLDSVYHPLNDKIIHLTQTMENLADDVTTLMKHKQQGVSAWKHRNLQLPISFHTKHRPMGEGYHRPMQLTLHRSTSTKDFIS
ncbi:hypothetical protein Bca52824_026989 [Brassica carinata]|uniref:Uncharacterized protein n=1 Tax=Brassica carinata TaxID=52824 RepID=A0A8X7SIN6_BRACI|nr:hypothetical protein Bca52824_026989 [Brassica carinata]